MLTTTIPISPPTREGHRILTAYPDENVLFPEDANEDTWFLFIGLGEDTRCPACEGAGCEGERTCPTCDGQGEIYKNESGGRTP